MDPATFDSEQTDNGCQDMFNDDLFSLKLTEVNNPARLDRFIPTKVETNLYSILE